MPPARWSAGSTRAGPSMIFVTGIHFATSRGVTMAKLFAPTGTRAPGRKLTLRDLKRAIITDRHTCQCVVCPCEHYAGRRPLCPMGRPSRGPNFERTPWVWSRGDGLGRSGDPTNRPPAEFVTKADYQPIDGGEVRRIE
eukprot:8296981-Pyramimonas_sp.AAC.1